MNVEEYEIPMSMINSNQQAKNKENQFRQAHSTDELRQYYELFSRMDWTTRSQYTSALVRLCRDGSITLESLVRKVNNILTDCGMELFTERDIDQLKGNGTLYDFHKETSLLCIASHVLESKGRVLEIESKPHHLQDSDEVGNQDRDEDVLSTEMNRFIRMTISERTQFQNADSYLKENFSKASEWFDAIRMNCFLLESFFKELPSYHSEKVYESYASIIEVIREYLPKLKQKEQKDFYSFVRAVQNMEIPVYRSDYQIYALLCSFEGLLS